MAAGPGAPLVFFLEGIAGSRMIFITSDSFLYGSFNSKVPAASSVKLGQHLVAGFELQNDSAFRFQPPRQVQNLLLCLGHLARTHRT